MKHAMCSADLKQPEVDKNADSCVSPQRNLPARGFKPATLLAIGGAVMIYGWWQYGKGAREQRCALLLPQLPSSERPSLPSTLPCSQIPPSPSTTPNKSSSPH